MTAFRIVDTHTHLCDSVFDEDRETVIRDAREAGVVAILVVSETLADAGKNLALVEAHSILKPLAGLYPAHVDWDQTEAMLAFVRENRDRLVGIGEVGLDFWVVKDKSQQVTQGEIFTQFIRLAEELDLPLNVHSRSAGRHVIDLLLKNGAKKVQLHAFDGKAATALPAVEAGYTFSIPPSIVRSRQKQKLVQRLPLSCLLVETDSPVLGSVAGKRNEPKHILEAVDCVAAIKGVRREAVVEATFENARRLYGDFLFDGDDS